MILVTAGSLPAFSAPHLLFLTLSLFQCTGADNAEPAWFVLVCAQREIEICIRRIASRMEV